MATDEPISIERNPGKAAGVEIIRLSGPLTLRNLFDFQNELRSTPPAAVTILDMTAVPYLDSSGMGAVINHHVHCQKCGSKLVVAGVNSRALELFLLTKVHTVIAMAANVNDAEALA